MNNTAGNRSRSRLLVLAPNWLGDVVMQTPLLTLLDDDRSVFISGYAEPGRTCFAMIPVSMNCSSWSVTAGIGD